MNAFSCSLRCASACALPLMIALASTNVQAQSMQSIQDKITQVQTSLNTFAAGATARLLTIGTKLDTIISKLDAPATPTLRATGAETVAVGEVARCVIVNAGTMPATGGVALFRGTTDIGSSSLNASPPGHSGSVTFVATQEERFWCRMQLGAGGEQLRGSLTIESATGTKLVRSDAH